MKQRCVVMAVMLLLGLPRIVPAGTADTLIDAGIVSTGVIRLTSTVEAVDQSRRTISLKRAKGDTITLTAGKSVKKFDTIKQGDQVEAEYLDSVAMVVRKPDGKSSPGFVHDVRVAVRGEDDEGMPVDTVEGMVLVEQIDYDKRTLTFKTSDGALRTISVDERVKKLRNLQKGDKIYLRYTEAVALSLKPVVK